MVKSEQSTDLGGKWFGKLQDEIAEASDGARIDFLTAVKPDSMGFYGKEGVDDED